MAIKQRKQRRLIRGLWWLLVMGILLLISLPLWFPWVLKPVAGRYGLRFTEYHRIGWTRFALTGVHGTWDGIRLDAQRVESVLPTTWLARRLKDHTNGPPLLSLSDSQLALGEATTNTVASARPSPPGSMGETLNQVSQIGLILQRWLPVADLTNCTLQLAASRVAIPHADWRAGGLRAMVRLPSTHGEVELAVQINGDSALKLTADWAAYEASVRGGFYRTVEGWRWQGELAGFTNRADLTAQFTTNGWWPAQAQVVGRDWQLPAKSLQVEGYESLVVSLTGNLISNRFDLQATGFAQPTDVAALSGWPAMKFLLGADGDPSGVKIHALNIQSPWLNADLTNTVGITRTGALLGEAAQLHIAVDLAKLPGGNLTGQVEGSVQIEPQNERSPVGQFRFSATQVQIGGLDAKSILVRGEFAAPTLKLDELRADLADGSVLLADGSYDVPTRKIVGGHWQLSGGCLEKLLPGLRYAKLAASGALDGPLTNLTHTGEATLTSLKTAGLKPLDVRAKWSGQHQHIKAVEVELTAGESVLTIGAAADLNVMQWAAAVNLNQLSLRRGSAAVYSLQQPAELTFRGGSTNASGPFWTLAVKPFNWRSERHQISASADFAWPTRGAVTLTATNVALAEFADFLEADLTGVFVADLAATAHWSNGPVHSVVSVTASATNGTGHVFSLRGAMQADERLKIELLALARGYAPSLSVTGTVPVQVIPDHGKDVLVWDASQRIALVGNWQDDQSGELLIPLGTLGQLKVSKPELSFQVSGTPAQPAAKLTAGAAQLAWQSKTNHGPRPRLEDLELEVELRPDLLRLKTFSTKLDGQPIVATGEWPLAKEVWRELWATGKLPDWQQAQGHLELHDALVAAVSAYLPDILAPEGHLSATVDLTSGKHLEGVLSLSNAVTRPMGPITPLREIMASVHFHGQRAMLEDFRAQIGGQPIRADGFVTIPQAAGAGLDYQVNLSGTNVPLARSPEFLLRGDFAMSLRGGSNQPAELSGVVTLRDGLYVKNASALVWLGPVRPEWRPPYFSVTNEPFADWKLALAVRGDHFLRVRTPVFSGIVSADFQLQGSLLAPVLTGDARINSGRLIFPFGSLTLNQGFASFNGNDQRGPDLQINAAGRNYRYELRLEVKGPADGANVLLSSTPPLAAEQILLMLTAGELPQSDFAFSNSARAGRIGTFLGSDLLSRYLGTDPAKERVIFRSGESISGDGRLTYSVEYQLTDRWSIIGAYDEFNAFNADLKWKVFPQ